MGGIAKLLKQRSLSADQAVELLAAKNDTGYPGLYWALTSGQTGTVKAYMDSILELLEQGSLSTDQAVELLAAKNDAGYPGLFCALRIEHADTVKAYRWHPRST